MLQWGAEFRQSSSQPPEGEKVLEDLVAFDVVLGDLNFDNCSSGELKQLKQPILKRVIVKTDVQPDDVNRRSTKHLIE